MKKLLSALLLAPALMACGATAPLTPATQAQPPKALGAQALSPEQEAANIAAKGYLYQCIYAIENLAEAKHSYSFLEPGITCNDTSVFGDAAVPPPTGVEGAVAVIGSTSSSYWVQSSSVTGTYYLYNSAAQEITEGYSPKQAFESQEYEAAYRYGRNCHITVEMSLWDYMFAGYNGYEYVPAGTSCDDLMFGENSSALPNVLKSAKIYSSPDGLSLTINMVGISGRTYVYESETGKLR